MKWLSISMKNTVERKNPSLSSVLTVENVLPEKYTLEHHQQHYHQVGGAINNDKKDTKRKLKHDSVDKQRLTGYTNANCQHEFLFSSLGPPVSLCLST